MLQGFAGSLYYAVVLQLERAQNQQSRAAVLGAALAGQLKKALESFVDLHS